MEPRGPYKQYFEKSENTAGVPIPKSTLRSRSSLTTGNKTEETTDEGCEVVVPSTAASTENLQTSRELQHEEVSYSDAETTPMPSPSYPSFPLEIEEGLRSTEDSDAERSLQAFTYNERSVMQKDIAGSDMIGHLNNKSKEAAQTNASLPQKPPFAVSSNPSTLLEEENDTAPEVENESDEEFGVMNLSDGQDISESDSDVQDLDQSLNEDLNRVHSDAELEEPIPMQAEVVQPFEKLQRLLKDDYKTPINTSVTATPAEVLRNGLALCKQHKWGHSEKEDLFKFVNSLFSSKVVPDSRYLLDTLFFSHTGLHYFFYCTKCSQMLGEIDITQKTIKTVMCPNVKCGFQNNVANLLESSYFVLFDIPHQVEAILKNDEIRSKLVDPSNFRNFSETLSDLYNGDCYREFASKLNFIERLRFISFTIALDGAALFTSCQCSIWPCFLMINELPPVLRSEHLILCGLWFGVRKAKMDLFLKPISENIRALSDPGFKINIGTEVWDMKAYVIANSADSGARGEIQGIHSHRGEYSCSWCLHKGVEANKARKFPFLFPFPEERTHNGMKEDARLALETGVVVNGVKFFPFLASSPMYDNVRSFTTEWMHAGCEGVAKAFAHAWIGKHGAEVDYYIGHPADIEKINNRIKAVKPPVEMRKKLRSFDDIKHWTGREWENWLLYFSVPILIDILPHRYLKHWILFVQAAHLLLKTEITSEMLRVANLLLIEFVGNVQVLYGLQMMTYNVHILLHLVMHVRNWGPLWSISGFTFERGIQKLKKMVLANNGIPNQICRALSEDQALIVLQNSDACSTTRSNIFCQELQRQRYSRVVELKGMKLLGKSRQYENPTIQEKWHCERLQLNCNDCLLFEKLLLNGCIFTSARDNSHGGRDFKTNNCFAYLKDSRFVKIKHILFDELTRNVFVIVARVRSEPYMCPPSVLELGTLCCFLHKVNSIDEDIFILPASEISGILVNVTVEEYDFLSPITNIFNTC